MLPTYYQCTSCRERFELAHAEGCYYFNFDQAPLDEALIPAAGLHAMPVRPGWCKDCAAVCLVEDIAATRVFEDAYGAARAGKPVEYPLHTEYLEPQEAQEELATYLRWRLARCRPARALCCGRTNYQLLDVAQPLLRHEECDFGTIVPYYIIQSSNFRAPTADRPANIRVFSEEGELTGLLTWQPHGSDTWEVIPAAYPPSAQTDDESA